MPAESFWLGLAGILAAGIFQGSFLLPMKWARAWAWENTWLAFSFFAYLVFPITLAALTVRQPLQVLAAADPGTIALVLACGVGWGLGALTFGLGTRAVGLALGFSVIIGLAACVGALIPLLLLGQWPSSASGYIALAAALGLMLSGVATCAWAGSWRNEPTADRSVGSYVGGLALCVVSGVLSGAGSVGFAVGLPLAERATALGTPVWASMNIVLAIQGLALFACNSGYAIALLRKNETLERFRRPGSSRECGYGALMGALWVGGFALYGASVQAMGRLGPSLGWGILMGAMVLTANLLGLLSGEWSSAPAIAKVRLRAGLAMLAAGIVGLAYANHIL